MTPVKKTMKISRDDQFGTIEVYDFSDSNIAGVFSNNIYGSGIVFMNLTSLILIIEDCMNKNAFPQPMSKFRKLNAESEQHRERPFIEPADIDIPQLQMPRKWLAVSPLRTFRERIIFRTMSGWQGEVKCTNTGRTLQFKSDMEFIMFMIDELQASVQVKEA